MLTVTGITAEDKAFDGTTRRRLTRRGAMLMGLVSRRRRDLDTSGAVGTFASAGPGTDIQVNDHRPGHHAGPIRELHPGAADDDGKHHLIGDELALTVWRS